MGWNDVTPLHDPLFEGVGDLVAYFANSYVCAPREPACVIATAEYQGDRFPAVVRVGRTWGVQFHPEKSSGPGLRILTNFLNQVRAISGEGAGA
jgi:glutamine amidotransferase